MTSYKWGSVLETDNIEEKIINFHNYIRILLDQYLPEKKVFMSISDKCWMTPELKQCLRKVQRERLKNGKSQLFKELWSKFRRKKRLAIKHFNSKNFKELKNTDPSKWYSMLKKMGGLEIQGGMLKIDSLQGLTDSQCAEAVAKSFAAISQQYEKLDRTKLPAFLLADRPEEVNVFQVVCHIKKLGKTKSTLPVDIPDRLGLECAIDLAGPITEIINSCLREERMGDPRTQNYWKLENCQGS